MAIKIPPRQFLTFAELLVRWQCTDADLCHAIIEGDLRPCVRMTGDHVFVHWVYDEWGDLVDDRTLPPEHVEYPPEDDGLPKLSLRMITPLDRWMVLRDPTRTGPFDCIFTFASMSRGAPKDNEAFPPEWFALPSPMTMEQVKADAVFLSLEVDAYETKHGGEPAGKAGEAPLSTKERNTLLLVIAALCKAHGYDWKTPSATASALAPLTDANQAPVSERALAGILNAIEGALATRSRGP